MGKDTKAVVTTPAHPPSTASETARPRSMSLEKAKKLIRKTSDEHKNLFRRLAK
jgi:hypothetical protein